MTATITNINGKNTIELIQDRDGAYRWYLGDADTEVSGKTTEEACEMARQTWGSKIEFDFDAKS
jgi:hypothetical protein